MSKLSILTAVVAYFAFSPTQLLSATKELENAIHKVLPVNDQPYVTLDLRQEYAGALLDYWQEFSNRIPRLSPAESAWMQEELNSQGERLRRAINSREAALQFLSSDVERCLSSLANLHAVYLDGSLAETEMFHWVGAVKCYSHIDQMVRYTKKAAISNGRFDGEFYAVGSSLIMDDLLNKLLPSAMADTMGWSISAD